MRMSALPPFSPLLSFLLSVHRSVRAPKELIPVHSHRLMNGSHVHCDRSIAPPRYVAALRTIGDLQVMNTVLGMIEDAEGTGDEAQRVRNEARVAKMLSIGVMQGISLVEGGDVKVLVNGIYGALPEQVRIVSFRFFHPSRRARSIMCGRSAPPSLLFFSHPPPPPHCAPTVAPRGSIQHRYRGRERGGPPPSGGVGKWRER